MLSITKARVQGIDKDVTKTGEDRRIVLCPRAVVILGQQLLLRESAMRAGLVKHDHLFFTDTGAPIRSLGYGYWRWQRTLKRLAIRYRKPYVARHTSVSWNLMIGRSPLLVAKEHGHRVTTMLSVYAAWTEGAPESDIIAIREAMTCTTRPMPDPPTRQTTSDERGHSLVVRSAAEASAAVAQPAVSSPEAAGTLAELTPAGAVEPFGSRFGSSEPPLATNSMKNNENTWWKGRDSNRPRHYECRDLNPSS